MSAEKNILKEELATLDDYLNAAQSILRSGHMPDITSLEKRVAAVCEAIRQAPKNLHEECVTDLIKFQEHLDTFEQEMRDFHMKRMKGDHGNA